MKGDPNLDLTAHWSQQQPLDSQAHGGILGIVLCAEYTHYGDSIAGFGLQE